jgi:hypothetical protein
LLPLISVDETSVELVAQAALALGIVFAGTCDGMLSTDSCCSKCSFRYPDLPFCVAVQSRSFIRE